MLGLLAGAECDGTVVDTLTRRDAATPRRRVKAGVKPGEDSAAAAVAAAAGAVVEKKGRGLKLGSMKIGSKKVEAIKNPSFGRNLLSHPRPPRILIKYITVPFTGGF